MYNKISKKLFKRKVTYFEFFAVMLGIVAGSLSLFGSLQTRGFLSVGVPFLGDTNLNIFAFIFGAMLLFSTYFFIKKKRKDIVLLSFISILGLLLFINFAFPLTTVFNPQGFDGVPPQTYQECKDINGIAMALNQNCGDEFIEYGNAGTNYICCLPDTCEGEWVRIYNQETKIFEKICQ